jgi:hypothetical protein
VPALGVVRAAGRHSEAAAADARYVSLAVLKWINRHPDRPLVLLSGRDDEGRTAVSGNLAVALAEADQKVWLSAPEERHEDLRRILYAAQKRTPPRPRPGRSPAESRSETRVNGAATADRVGTGPRPAAGSPAAGTYGARPMAGAVATRSDDPEATVVMEAPRSTPVVVPAPSPAADPPAGVLLGRGEVVLCPLDEHPAEGVVVVDAPAADTDERGVRAAQAGVAVLVVARDRTRNRELVRLVDRLRSAGAQTVGFVLTGGRGA